MQYDSTVRSIVIDRRNRRNAVGSMSKARTVCTTAFSTGSSDRPALEIGEEAVAEVGERGGALFGGHVAAAL